MEIADRLFEELKLVKDKTYDVMEQFGKISDTLQAIDKDHNWIQGMLGHDVDYFASSSHNCLADIIAHLSENYWSNNKSIVR